MFTISKHRMYFIDDMSFANLSRNTLIIKQAEVTN